MIASLLDIQRELRAPKNCTNDFGGYKYRSAEQILENVKPILHKYGVQMTITDDIVAINDRVYVKATVVLKDADGNTETTTAFAREPDSKKGADPSMVTGAASSYARKYALNGLFLIDDCKDPDTNEYQRQMNTEDSKKPKVPTAKTANRKISAEQQAELIKACANAPEALSLENALRACNRTKVEDVTETQYYALMQRLQAA